MDCDVNINNVLADLKMKAQPNLTEKIAQKYKTYQRRHQGPRHKSSHNKQLHKHTKFHKAKNVQVNQVDTMGDMNDNTNEYVDKVDAIEEDVSCLRMDDDSDVDNGFVLAVETCLGGCDDDDSPKVHLN